jgi:lipoprotein-anchoring transpeptidase ErfK/SrfK
MTTIAAKSIFRAKTHRLLCAAGALVVTSIALGTADACAQALAMNADRNGVSGAGTYVSASVTDTGDLPARLHRQIVNYPSNEPAGTIIVDTPNTYLYFVLGEGRAIRYGIGVGREGFTWSGTKTIERKTEWPDWVPPAEMLERQPYLPRFMAGGPGNPLGARAMYLSGTVYRIHGTNAPATIGSQVSSGCIRMLNEDVIDLYGRTHIGTKVVVLPDFVPPAESSAHAAPAGAISRRIHTSSLY